jgi:hypothetical protein
MRSRDACGCRAREAPCCVCAHVIEFAEVATRSHAGTETQSAESRPWRKPKQRTIAAPPRGTRRLAFYRMFGSDCCAVPTRRRASERRRESLTGTGRSGWAVTKLDRPAEHSLHSHARGTNAAQRARTPRRRTAGQRHGHPAPSALPSPRAGLPFIYRTAVPAPAPASVPVNAFLCNANIITYTTYGVRFLLCSRCVAALVSPKTKLSGSTN